MTVYARPGEPAGSSELARRACLAMYDGDRTAAVDAAVDLARIAAREDRIGSSAAIVRFLDQVAAQLAVLQRLFPDPDLEARLTLFRTIWPSRGHEARHRVGGERGAARRRD